MCFYSAWKQCDGTRQQHNHSHWRVSQDQPSKDNYEERDQVFLLYDIVGPPEQNIAGQVVEIVKLRDILTGICAKCRECKGTNLYP